MELDQDFPGTETYNAGTFTRRTKFFDYRATSAGTNNTNGSTGIAVARRIDTGSGYNSNSDRYYAFIVYPENKISCSEGANSVICKSLGF